MKDLIIGFIDALIPLSFAVLLLVFPRWFTKKDLNAPENKGTAQKLRMAGWLLLAAGGLVLIANLGKKLTE